MAIQFDGPNLLITLESGVTALDVQDLYEAWKDWVRAGNGQFPYAFRPDGGAPLSAIINQGSYFFLNNLAGWRIKPPEEDITIYLTGNLAVEDTALPAFIPTTGNFTAAILGLQPVTQGVTPVMAEQLEFASYQGAVWLDATSTRNGTESISGIGNREYPINSVNNAVAIAVGLGIDTLGVIGNFTFTSGDDITGFRVKGQNPVLSTITIETGANVLNCQLLNATIKDSILDGNSWLSQCNIENLTYVEGRVENCMLAGDIILAGTEDTFFVDCKSGCVGVGATDLPKIDCGGSGRNLALRNWAGPVLFKNLTGANNVCIDIVSGATVTLDSTITSGNIYVRGIADLIDNSTGTAVVSTEAMDDPKKAREIHQLFGLMEDMPVTISNNAHASTGLTVSITDNGNGTITLARVP